MGFNSPAHNVKNYSSSKPPLVIFVMCLLLFASATLAMAFYIQYTDIVLNPEIRENWKTFLNRLDSLELCTFADETASDETVAALSRFVDGGTYNSTSDETSVSITVAASLFLVREFKKFPAGITAVTGKVHVDGLPKTFRDGGEDSSFLNATFVIPRNLTETKYRDTCVILTGPDWLIPLGRRSDLCVPSSIDKSITHAGSLIAVKSNETGIACRNGSSVRLSYNNQSDDEFYLSKEERWNVYVRLVHTSYFLFMVAVAFICYSLVRERMRSSLAYTDKVPLTL